MIGFMESAVMRKRFPPLLALLSLALAAAACLPAAGSADPVSPDEVATVVALTLQAMTPVGEGTVTREPEPAGLLPHSLYYLGRDGSGLTQVFRIEKDGTTTRQVTSEPVNAGSYTVSPVNGSVAYVVNNQLVLVDANGAGRRILVDGGPEDELNPFVNRISNPVFSPDGETLAYGHQGLNFYTLSTGVNDRVIENQLDDLGSGMIIPKELYWPEKYSPDGSRLMITLGYYEGADAAFYYPETRSLVRLGDAPGALICCDLALWSADGTKVHSANAAAGMFNPGLWEVDPGTGAVTTLLASSYDTSTFNLAKYPYMAPDNQLYYFFLASDTGEYSRTPLQLVRSAPDGVTGRVVLSEETFETMNEALWSPDASSIIIAYAPDEGTYQGGRAEIVYLDGRSNVVLAPFAQQMEWGP